jgi:hypothetical protein
MMKLSYPKKAMKHFIITFFCMTMLLFSCCETEDPGPEQEGAEEFAVLDFDQLEIGSGLHIQVEQSNTFAIRAEGDQRNIRDLEVFKSGSTLIIRFDENNSERRHDTYLSIRMPLLNKVNFSGGSVSVITGFESDEPLDFILSGGSVSQLDGSFKELNLSVSGGSTLKLNGSGDKLKVDASGASILSGLDYPVREARVTATGASIAKVTVSEYLTASASGASSISYRGDPRVENTASGGSLVVRE